MKTSKNTTRRVKVLIGLISVAVPVVVILLNGILPRVESLTSIARKLPIFHALLNGTTTLLLVLGYISIKRKKIRAHRVLMAISFALSTLFLISYVVSKLGTDPVPFGGSGWIANVYYFILITHIVLSALILPMILMSIYYALSQKYDRHKRISRITFPLWIYVTSTGVVVYLFMAPYY